MEIKICGITGEYEIDALIEDKVEYAGFVMFYEKSKRNLSVERARELVAYAKEKASKEGHTIKSVAVVVSPDLKQLKLIKEAGFDVVQIHGNLSDDLLNSIDLTVFRAYNIESGKKLEINSGNIAGIVLDAAIPGKGKCFDWHEYTGFDAGNAKFILAGGLNPSNVAKAIETMNPDIVDCSSGVEYEDRLGKDIEKIHAFVKNARK